MKTSTTEYQQNMTERHAAYQRGSASDSLLNKSLNPSFKGEIPQTWEPRKQREDQYSPDQDIQNPLPRN